MTLMNESCLLLASSFLLELRESPDFHSQVTISKIKLYKIKMLSGYRFCQEGITFNLCFFVMITK